MCDQNKEDGTAVPKSDCSPNGNPDGKPHVPAVDSPDVRIVWGSEGERPRMFISGAVRARSMARTREIRREEYRQQHGRDYPSPFDDYPLPSDSGVNSDQD
jgi:hypothetical protein